MTQRRPKNITELSNKSIWTAKDETKRMIKYLSVESNIVNGKTYNCWWCTLPIVDQDPLGCPISQQDGIYDTEGIFCTVNCIKAYLLEHCQNDSKYQNSIALLSFMYHTLSGATSLTEAISIVPSPPWKFLTQYGGFLTQEQYKEKIGKFIFKKKGIIKQHPITFLYTEKTG